MNRIFFAAILGIILVIAFSGFTPFGRTINFTVPNATVCLSAGAAVSTGTGVDTSAPRTGLIREYLPANYYDNGSGLEAGITDTSSRNVKCVTSTDAKKPTLSGDHLVCNRSSTLTCVTAAADSGDATGFAIVLKIRPDAANAGAQEYPFQINGGGGVVLSPYWTGDPISGINCAWRIPGNVDFGGQLATATDFTTPKVYIFNQNTAAGKVRAWRNGVGFAPDTRALATVTIGIGTIGVLDGAGANQGLGGDFYGARVYARSLTDAECINSPNWTW
jgi:hypothetical protein